MVQYPEKSGSELPKTGNHIATEQADQYLPPRTTGTKDGKKLVPLVWIEQTTYRLPYHFVFRRHPKAFVVWTIPSPWLSL
ncbi:hypothetical protein [Uliginosibacterium aquaticum]|uniref:Uncharacterized protein n=1 Tax=Uliginosibacterium aquaticum TaxID=2731212 RepID=A0ABX2IHZ6_9RHOO|nr:hypothetical protein [Uliginosibacterium aquaticum]NSL56376.1 hypothetical protein [Uliginosibacterium aquaticum]